jgi:hypothetical protein
MLSYFRKINEGLRLALSNDELSKVQYRDERGLRAIVAPRGSSVLYMIDLIDISSMRPRADHKCRELGSWCRIMRTGAF